MLEKTKSLENKLLFNTYARYPVEVVKGKGVWVYDSSGKKYCDLLAGISVCNLGHCHPEITAVIKEQAETLIHISNLFYQQPQLELADKLLATSKMNKVFFCNSGAEANEAAIKLTRRFVQVIKGEKRYKIITINGSFHGRTLATLSATGQIKLKKGFEPLPEGFVHAPLNDLNGFLNLIDEQTAGIMIETIQGEGGVRPLNLEFLLGIQKTCKKYDLIFIIDEIQTGLGRTGSFWSYQDLGLDPDIVTTAKALGNGLPIGAMMAKDYLAEAFSPGSHGSTFGGGALVCKVACKVLEIIQRDKLVQKAKRLGEELLQSLHSLKHEFSEILEDVRGRGLMIGIELKDEEKAKTVWSKLLEKGFITNLTQQKVIRLLPPLLIGKSEINAFLDCLKQLLKAV